MVRVSLVSLVLGLAVSTVASEGNLQGMPDQACENGDDENCSLLADDVAGSMDLLQAKISLHGLQQHSNTKDMATHRKKRTDNQQRTVVISPRSRKQDPTCSSEIGNSREEHGRTWVPLVDMELNQDHETSAAIPGKKLSDYDINQYRKEGSLLWLECGPCNSYFRWDKEWDSMAATNTGRAQSQCASDNPDGPYKEAMYSSENPHHKGADCMRGDNGGGAIYFHPYRQGCFCWKGDFNHGDYAGTLYASVDPNECPEIPETDMECQTGLGTTIQTAGHLWSPVVKMQQNHLHASADAVEGVKLSDANINEYREEDSILWLECGPCNSYFKWDKDWDSMAATNTGRAQSQCASDNPDGPYKEAMYSSENPHHKGADCMRGDNGGGAIYFHPYRQGCFCWKGDFNHGDYAGTLYVSRKSAECPPKWTHGAMCANERADGVVLGASPDIENPGHFSASECRNACDANPSCVCAKRPVPFDGQTEDDPRWCALFSSAVASTIKAHQNQWAYLKQDFGS